MFIVTVGATLDAVVRNGNTTDTFGASDLTEGHNCKGWFNDTAALAEILGCWFWGDAEVLLLFPILAIFAGEKLY